MHVFELHQEEEVQQGSKFGWNFFEYTLFKVDQFVLSYGGLRGAIAFGLAISIPEDISAKPMFITTTIAVIYFTVLIQVNF